MIPQPINSIADLRTHHDLAPARGWFSRMNRPPHWTRQRVLAYWGCFGTSSRAGPRWFSRPTILPPPSWPTGSSYCVTAASVPNSARQRSNSSAPRSHNNHFQQGPDTPLCREAGSSHPLTNANSFLIGFPPIAPRVPVRVGRIPRGTSGPSGATVADIGDRHLTG